MGRRTRLREAPRARRAIRSTARIVQRSVTKERVTAAVRAAIAAMAAWIIGNLLPGDVQQYAYAAPLGAFVATGPTVATIARAAAQQVTGLTLGALLALGMLALDVPGLATIGIVAALAVLAQSIPRLAAAASVIPVAALLVIIFGGVDADGYAIAYVGQFAIGLAIGLLVNALVRPPLHGEQARTSIRTFVDELANRFEALAELVRGQWPPERDDWAEWGDELEREVDELVHEVRVARESRRFNLRTLWDDHDPDRDDADVEALRVVVHRAGAVLDALHGSAWSTPVRVELTSEHRLHGADAIEALAAHVRAWSSGTDIEEASRASGEAIDALYRHVVDSAEPESGAAAVIFALRAMQERVDRAAQHAA